MTLLQPDQQNLANACPLPFKLASVNTPQEDDSVECAERQLSDSELAYFLPSLETGVNDM